MDFTSGKFFVTGFKDGGEPLDKECQKPSRTNNGPWLTRKLRPQSYNDKELNSANNLDKLGTQLQPYLNLSFIKTVI